MAVVDKLLPVMAASHTGAGLSLGCSSFNPAPWQWPGRGNQRWAKCLGSYHPYRRSSRKNLLAPGFDFTQTQLLWPSKEWTSTWKIFLSLSLLYNSLKEIFFFFLICHLSWKWDSAALSISNSHLAVAMDSLIWWLFLSIWFSLPQS